MKVKKKPKVTVTAKVAPDLQKSLFRLSKRLKMSRSALIEQSVRELVTRLSA